VQNICIGNIEKLANIFYYDIETDRVSYDKILALLKSKSREFDGDRLVKYSVVKYISTLFRLYQLSSDDLTAFL